ncbi:MAG TPA: hypothetical protein VNT77_10670 [Allosphingosinicella sp.]|nr:hypothetical protein [Allosphingosinicella sp.]
MKIMMMTAAAMALALSAGAPAAAQEKGQTAKTPANWSWEMKNGQRVPKAGNRVVHADGSWTEEIRQGNCTITRTGRAGEVREVRKCD